MSWSPAEATFWYKCQVSTVQDNIGTTSHRICCAGSCNYEVDGGDQVDDVQVLHRLLGDDVEDQQRVAVPVEVLGLKIYDYLNC